MPIPYRMHKILDVEYLTIYIVLITLAEITVAYVNPQIGIFFHISILCILFIHLGLVNKEKMLLNELQWLMIKEKKKPSDLMQVHIEKKGQLTSILLPLTIIPLIRILSLVMPLSHFPRIQWFIITGFAIYLAFFVILFQQKIHIKDCGLQFPTKKNIPTEIGIILLGIPLGFTEYFILRPAPFVDSFSIENIIIAVLILFLATGLMEEIIFRGLLQKKSIEILGIWPGILFVTIIFAVLHIGNLSLLDVLLVFSIGGLYSIVVKKTKTIIGVSVSHTLVNVFLFIICPLILI
jgi:membrane protease YdiL (CAAX protease family)